MGLYDVETDHRSSIEYQLSDQHFVKQGWTVLPIAKTMTKIVQYQARLAKPHLNWFEKHKLDGKIYYDDGSTVFLNFRIDGSGQVFHPNGKLAIEVCRPENRKYDMCTVFSPGGKDCVGVERKSEIVAVFDTTGNGAVFDEDGATRLSYNQIGGISRDNPAGPSLTWKWDADEKKSIVKTVYAEKPAAHLERFLHPRLRPALKSSGSGKATASPASSRNKEKKVAEQEHVVAAHDEEEEVASRENFREETCHLKVICMKLTDHVSLRILNRRNINLQFFAVGKSIRIELGTILNLDKEVKSYFVDSSSKHAMLKCKFDKLSSAKLEADSSLLVLAKNLREVKKSAVQRKLMVAKYRPYLRAWEQSKTRCRP
ncbi:uncharacterized protein LOC122400375 [Colletes gigas]|uniref:uncharacterized protein LOC122400375 n=1 Tax=Colletes gigas TaxID=935657 RepID=UPI001C9B0EF0|nr:uncharacterized protein LOC122400375 [Colletes gigas]